MRNDAGSVLGRGGGAPPGEGRARDLKLPTRQKSTAGRGALLTASNTHWLWERVLDRVHASGMAAWLLIAALIGAGTALGAVFFIELISWVERGLYFHLPKVWPSLGRGWYIVAPVIGSLIAGPIIAFFSPEAKGHGVPEVMEAIALRGARIRPRVVVAKVAASAACIGSGGSAGREGPIVQVGAAFGSTIAQVLKFSESRTRNLVAAGAAAGIAATFNAPIAGVLFALEVILGELALRDLSSVVLAAVTASTVARSLLGNRPAFGIPFYATRSPWEILIYLILGLFGALIGVAFIRVLYFTEDLFDRWEFPTWLKPAVGALILGTLGFLYPQVLGLGFVPEDELRLAVPLHQNLPHVFGSGFPVIEDALLGNLSLTLMVVLVFLKLIATALTLGAGNSGGVFAPALFMGAMTGGSFGWVVHKFFPTVAAGSGSYATVGMAAVFAAAARAPLTAIMIVFELTDDYRILLPLMAAVVVSVVIAERMEPESIYTLKLVRRGIRLFRGRDMDVLASVTVAEVMDPNPVTVSPDIPASSLGGLFLQTNSHAFPVVDEQGYLWGIVSLADYRHAVGEKRQADPGLKVRDIAVRSVIVAYPDETLRDVAQRMAPRDISRLPVVDRKNPRKLLGVIRRNDIVHAYELGMVRRGFALGSLPGAPPGTAIARFVVAEGSPLVGRALAEIPIPDDFLLIHIDRQGEAVLPHGDTVLQAGDTISLLAREGDEEALQRLWKQLNTSPQAAPSDGESAASPPPAEGA